MVGVFGPWAMLEHCRSDGKHWPGYRVGRLTAGKE